MKIYEYNKIKYRESEVKPIAEIDDSLAMKMEDIKADLKDDGACIYNAILAAKSANEECVEGFVICMGNGYPGAIPHCWNKMGDNYFDITKDCIWAVTRAAATFYYFPLATFSTDIYGSDYRFRSDAVQIAGAVSAAVNTEAKAMESYNYINFLT